MRGHPAGSTRSTSWPGTRASQRLWPKGTACTAPQAGRRAGRSCPRFRRRSRWKGNGGRGRLAKDKPPILGLIQRGGQVVLRVLANVQQATIKPVITAAVALGTLIHTDEYSIYARLPAWGHGHKTVCHARGEYARDEDGDGFCEVHVNMIEGFWSLLRSWLTAPGHFAGQAAALSRLLPIRAQRAPTRQSPAGCSCYRTRPIVQTNTPEPDKSHRRKHGRMRGGRAIL